MVLRHALRTIDLARAAGISVQQVRNYEVWGCCSWLNGATAATVSILIIIILSRPPL